MSQKTDTTEEIKKEIIQKGNYLFQIVDVKLKNLAFFNSRHYGNYTKDGGIIQYLGPQGLPLNGFTTSKIFINLTTDKIEDQRTIAFLMFHPENVANGGNSFVLRNMDEERKNAVNHEMEEALVVQQILQKKRKDLKAACAFLSLPFNESTEELKVSLLRRAKMDVPNGANGSEKGYLGIKKAFESKKSAMILVIREMLSYKIISINNSGIYVNGDISLGLNEDQVIVYLNANPEVYSLLKRTLNDTKKNSGDLDTKEEKTIVDV